MSCHICHAFLHDFLLTGIPDGIPIQKDLRKGTLPRISWTFTHWIYRVFHNLESQHLEKAQTSASLIARRGRKEIEYEYLLSTATFNFLKYEVPWLQEEEEYMTLLLMESGLLKGKNTFRLLSVVKDYLRYTTIRAIYLLKQVHDDHVNPKGLMTNLDHLVVKRQKEKEKEKTLCDRDDYQKEVLVEVSLDEFDDLYN